MTPAEMKAEFSRWPSDWQEAFVEKSAILEYCDGLSRDMADVAAFEALKMKVPLKQATLDFGGLFDTETARAGS